ncbi:hypothetical protein WJ96_04195 [Burkholderia ubonensis]|uniref:Uncharacterized protein n=1 Tax=Burkholderia ubonensis TaxID=101571 RepID=A0AAW3MX35_9BURK|nr:hypothetical protein [Burkholderia ubonensis]KVP65575.1 hypothetical protein WJ93_23940 [Burkholderia ubonensis]KVP97776.1 hypothetical protein WJ96_04195 [Burkholderia ubonensis]KVZ92473.1 hypothetical protein WL25_15850 [Burkholderia ubonensis]
MGEARRKRAQAELLAAQRGPLEDAVKKVSHALRRLAEAASASLGADCYTHAELGRVLLADQGFTFQTRVGFAAWRVGRGDGDVLSHVPNVQAYLPAGANGMGFAYHAWLESVDWVVDVTTYQLRRKGQELDAADGGHTSVDWCPDYLLLTRAQVSTYKKVAQAPGPGLAYYESNDDLTVRMAQSYQLDAEDVATARLILSNPDMRVLGPNMLPQD